MTTIDHIRTIAAAALLFATAAGSPHVAAAAPAGEFSLPSKPLPARTQPIGFTFAAGAGRDLAARAGQRIDTPCFSVIAGRDGDARVNGCSVALYDKDLGGTDVLAYFRINVLSDRVAGAGALASEELAKRKALTAADPALAGQGPYAIPYAGPFLGMTKASIFSLDARMLSWGHRSGDTAVAKIMVLSMLPLHHYRGMGYDIDAIQIQAFPAGRDSDASIRSLASVRMK